MSSPISSVRLTVDGASAAKSSCFGIGILALCLGFLWQCTTVYRNYGGDWTALFCIGSVTAVPPELHGGYRFQQSTGFDGQFYYIIALDPLFRRGLDHYVDWPGLRYRRILVPALAYAGALGQPNAIAYGYILINLGFLFLGTLWMSKHAVLSGRHAAWGLAFLAAPAVLISLDRQTVDLALTALCLGVTYAWRTKRWNLLYLLLGLACMVRETGLVVAVAFLVTFIFRCQWRAAALVVLSTVPFWAWSWYVGDHFPALMQEWLPTHPYAWFAQSLLHPKPLPFPASIQGLVRCIDILALMGFVIGCVLSIQVWRNSRGQSPAMLANVLFADLVIYLFSLDDWMHVYDYGRISSPMAAYLTVERFTASWLFLLPSVLMTVRVVVQLAPQVLHAFGTPF